MKKTHIIVHHSLVSYDKNPNQYEAIRKYHLGKGWGDFTGYNFIIEKNGKVVTARSLNTPGAHTKQGNMNFVGIGICLTGNFDIEKPTKEQCKSLHDLILKLQKDHSIPDANIFAHRHYATYKSCWGNLLPNDVMGYLRQNLHIDIPEWGKESWDKAIKKGVIKEGDDPERIVMDSSMEETLIKSGVFEKSEGTVTLLRWVVALDRLERLN